ncbi:MAG TPA: efflux RND transporter periplasmic adaptor subunit [Bryobacteraceae bacterium]
MNPMAMMMMQAAPIRAVPALASDVPLDTAAVGNVEAISSVDVKSRVAGQILSVHFQEGQDVGKGQLLFEIDPEPFQRQIAQIQADLAKDQALEVQARANVAKDEAMLKQTQASANRGLQLEKEGIFSKEQTEQLVASNGSNLALLDADKAAVESAVASIKSDRARLSQTELQLSYTKIVAPISGRAGAIAVKAGNLVKDNDATLVSILQISPIYVSFGVPQQLLPEVQKYNRERPLVVRAEAGGDRTETGVLRFIDNNVDTTTGTIKLKAEFPNTSHALWPGQYVNVNAQLKLERGRIVVPSRTVESGPQGKYVWVVNPATNTAAMRPVSVARLYKQADGAEQAVIATGLQPGEMVVSEGQMRLFPGGKVQLLKPATQMSGSEAKPAGQS